MRSVSGSTDDLAKAKPGVYNVCLARPWAIMYRLIPAPAHTRRGARTEFLNRAAGSTPYAPANASMSRPAPVPRSAARAQESFVLRLMADARFYQHLRRSRNGRAGSLAWTLLSNRGLWLLTFHRIAYYCVRHRNVRAPLWWCARILQGLGTGFSVLLCRSDLSGDCEITGPTYLSNRGYLICGARSIGAGSLIHERCTLGYAVARRTEGRPIIGRNVWIGPNSIIVGAITVGDGATVLPGSFVTYSVPPAAVVKGNPSAIVRRDFDNSELRSSLVIVQDVATVDP
jgi:serine acetyltransferase